jgi:phosphoesterase RecJ-like protein
MFNHMQALAKQIDSRLKKAEKILLVAHQNPDGDCLGSATALIEYLGCLNKQTALFCGSPIPKRYQFLPHVRFDTLDKRVFSEWEAEVILILDSGDLKYAGIAEELIDHPAVIINIDHHPTNTKYGHINLIHPAAASTTEIIYRYFKINNARINRDMATALLTGLISDTDNFSNPATSESALTVAGELLRLGANTTLIHNWLTKNKTVNILKLWGTVLSRLETVEEIDMAYTYITNEDTGKYKVGDAELEGISNFLNRMDGPKISLLIKETPDGKIKGSFRTSSDDVDVAAIAKKMGGGGHKKAAGFTADGTIDDVLNRIIEIQTHK